MLETVKHAASAFVTLTYASDSLPENASLVPTHVQLWLKRFRKVVGKCRYFLVGEYGAKTWRPHYHVALFGVPLPYCVTCRYMYNRKGCNCSVFSTWKQGNVYVGDLTKDSAQYVAGYVTKKMTKKTDPRLLGRHPEFARMSLRPGIGAAAMEDVAKVITSEYGCDEFLRSGDVPQSLNHGKKSWQLGRYLRSRLRKEVGLNEEMLKTENFYRWSEEMVHFFEEKMRSGCLSGSLKQVLVDENAQKALNQKKRFELYIQKERKL